MQNYISSFMNIDCNIITKGKFETLFLLSLSSLTHNSLYFQSEMVWFELQILSHISFILFYLSDWQWYIRVNKPYPVLNTFLVLKANRAESWMRQSSAPVFILLFVFWKGLMEKTW